MKRLTAIALFCLMSACSFLYAEPVNIDNGVLRLGGILQTSIYYHQETTKPKTEFKMDRARFLFWGTLIPDKVKYFIQTEAVQAIAAVVKDTLGGMESAVKTPFLLDTKLSFNYIPKTEITIGRFLPAFTIYMPRPVSKLDVVNYPLLVPAYAMWRQVGVQTTTQTKYLDFNLGLFNGYPSNNWSDNNDNKDALFSGAIKPVDFVKILGYGWMGNVVLDEPADLAKNRYGGGLSINRKFPEKMALVINGEYVLGEDETIAGQTTKSAGYYGHVGFSINPYVELIVRYDNFDPDTDTDNNATSWITGGLNLKIKGDNAKIAVNYVNKQEEGTSVDNDIFVTQFQVSF